MGFNFPNSPTVGDLWPTPLVAGQPQYRWNGTEWTSASIDPAGGYIKRSGDTMTGPLVLSGDPIAALHPVTKQYLDAQRQRIALGGLSSTDIQVPATAKQARLTFMGWFGGVTGLGVQVSVTPGVFRSTSGDYTMYGSVISTTTGLSHANGVSTAFFQVASNINNNAQAVHVEAFVTLTRFSTAQLFNCGARASAYNVGEHGTQFWNNFLNAGAAGSALNILALRFYSSTVFTAESYLNVEWL